MKKRNIQEVGRVDPPQSDNDREVERVSTSVRKGSKSCDDDVDEDGSPELIVSRPESGTDGEHVLMVRVGEEVEAELEETSKVADLTPSGFPQG